MSFVGRDSIDEQSRKAECTFLEAMIAAIPWSIKEMMESPKNQYITPQRLRTNILELQADAWFRIKDNPKLTKADQLQLYSYLSDVIKNQFKQINEEAVHIQLQQQRNDEDYDDDEAYKNAKSYIKKKSGKTPKGTKKAVLTIQGKKEVVDAKENAEISSSLDSTAEDSSGSSSNNSSDSSSVSSLLSGKIPKICPYGSNDSKDSCGSGGGGRYIERNIYQHQIDDQDDDGIIFFENAEDFINPEYNHEEKDECDLDLDAEMDFQSQSKPIQKKKGLRMEGSFFTTSRDRNRKFSLKCKS